MTIKNKSTLGTPNFIKEFYQDCKSGIATGWWGENYGRRGERVNVELNEQKLLTVYDLINYIKDNFGSITSEDIEATADYVYKSYPALKFKRAYKWEVEDKDVVLEEVVEEETLIDDSESEQETVQEDTQESESVEEKPIPDFEYAKTIEDKQELKAYAKEFGFKLDSRKALSDMMKSFQGKYHASKNK